jgi:hypothetical protein
VGVGSTDALDSEEGEVLVIAAADEEMVALSVADDTT